MRPEQVSSKTVNDDTIKSSPCVEAVLEASEFMLDWQARMADNLRARCVRRAGTSALSAWRDFCIGSRRQRRMIVKGAAAWVKSKLRRGVARWRENAGFFRRQANTLRRVARRLTLRKMAAAFRSWAEMTHERQRLTAIARGIVHKVTQRGKARALNAWFACVKQENQRQSKMRHILWRMRNRRGHPPVAHRYTLVSASRCNNRTLHHSVRSFSQK